ncbi:MAG: DUF5687 family protein, partial [Hymenobacteraceae bacterium]|nr:DUF5687 family protein [Hymenobacteraceae bacterium]MDX5397445.1 DUF5687 family protein [Hymenobacteraceae bacterium]MDX5443769.1 DUF5687 family protein [Hymenobacteraceae bacterium]MDX5513523.1 DUF5687 family protein [Hymenobacteraceae bacterium]
QFIIVLPIMFLPPLLYVPVSYIGYPKAGLAFIGIVGAVSLLFHRFWLQKITNRLIRKKHAIAAGFR